MLGSHKALFSDTLLIPYIKDMLNPVKEEHEDNMHIGCQGVIICIIILFSVMVITTTTTISNS